MPANFNTIAKFYDRLAGLVFGDALKTAQVELLQFVPPNSSVLIIGGGSGWILDEITKVHDSGLRITYVDSSSKMIAQSQKRRTGNNTVTFINCPVEELTLQNHYDLIITSFLFDMFSLTTCDTIIRNLSTALNPNGLWLYADFQLTSKSSAWQKFILRLMYSFFRISCRIEATRLPDVEVCFSNYSVVSEQSYHQNFIISKVFKNDPGN